MYPELGDLQELLVDWSTLMVLDCEAFLVGQCRSIDILFLRGTNFEVSVETDFVYSTTMGCVMVVIAYHTYLVLATVVKPNLGIIGRQQGKG